MKIVVCVKQVPDSDDVKINQETGTLLRGGAAAILNPSDKHALSLVANLKKQEENVTVSVLTMGPPMAEQALREGLAYGFDEGILLCDKMFAGADTYATASTLAAGIRKTGMPDLIFTGYRSTDGETGHVGIQLAEHLKIPVITKVKSLQLDTKKRCVSALHVRDGQEEQVEVQVPVLCTIDEEETEVSYLKVGEIFDAWEKPIKVYGGKELEISELEVGLAGSKTKVVRTYMAPKEQKENQITENVQEAVEMIFETFLKKHLF